MIIFIKRIDKYELTVEYIDRIGKPGYHVRLRTNDYSVIFSKRYRTLYFALRYATKINDFIAEGV